MKHIADIRCPYASVPGSHKNTMIAPLRNNILNLAKKSTLLLSLAPCMLLAKNKLEDPTNVPPTTDDRITDTRTHTHNTLTSASAEDGESLLAIDSLNESDFVEILVKSRGTDVRFNPGKGKFQFRDSGVSTDKYIWADPEDGSTTISDITRSVYNDLKWNLHKGGSNLYEYDTENDTYNQVGSRLNWKDAVKVGDTYYGVKGNQLRSYKEGEGVKVLHALDPAADGDLRKIEVDASGNLCLYSLRRLSRSDRTHGMWEYNMEGGGGTMKRLHTENNDELDFTLVSGLAVVGKDLYICHRVVNNVAEPQKTVIMRYDGKKRTYEMWKEIDAADTGGNTANDFVGFVNDDGLVRFALQFLDWEKTLILKQELIADQVLAEDFGSSTIDLADLTSTSADVKSVKSVLPAGVVDVTIVGNTLTLSSIADAHGTTTVAITVTDASGGTSEVTFDVRVNAVNDAPTIADIGDITVDEDAANMTINTNIADVDGDMPTVSVSSSNTNVTATLDDDNNIVLGFAEDFNTAGSGAVTITVTADDGNGGVARRTFDVRVNAVNDAPTIADIGDITVDEDAANMTINTDIADVDGDTPTVSVSSSNTNVTATLDDDNNIVLGFAEDFNTAGSGAVTITVTADDGNGGVARRTFDVRVNAVNDAPTIADIGDITVDEDAANMTINTDIADVDGDMPTVSVSSSNTNVTATLDDDNNIVLGFAEDFNTAGSGAVTITVTADDENGGVTQRTFGVTITAQNDAPGINSAIADQTFDEDANGIEVTNPGFTDVEGEDITYSVRSNHARVTASLNGNNNINLTLAENFNTAGGSAVQITLTADDGNGGVTDAVWGLTVSAVNDAPTVVALHDVTFDEDATDQTIDTDITDVDGDTPTVSVASSHANVTASIDGTNDIVLAFAENFNTARAGPVTITLTADDENGGVTQRTFGVTINAQNDAPGINSALADQTFDEDANGIEVTNPGFTDVEGDDITYSVRSNHASVTASLNGNNNINLTLAENFNTASSGPVTITLTADDGNGGVARRTFLVNITPTPDNPTLEVFDPIRVPAGTADSTFNILSKADYPDGTIDHTNFTITNTNPDVASLSLDENGNLTVSYNGVGSATVEITLSVDGKSVNQQFSIDVERNILGVDIADIAGHDLTAGRKYEFPSSLLGVEGDISKYRVIPSLTDRTIRTIVDLADDGNIILTTAASEATVSDDILIQDDKGRQANLQIKVVPWVPVFGQSDVSYRLKSLHNGCPVIEDIGSFLSSITGINKVAAFAYLRNGNSPEVVVASQEISEGDTGTKRLFIESQKFIDAGIVNGSDPGLAFEVNLFAEGTHPTFMETVRHDYDIRWIDNFNSEVPTFDLANTNDNIVSMRIDHSDNIEFEFDVLINDQRASNATIDLANVGATASSGVLTITGAVGSGSLTIVQRPKIGPVYGSSEDAVTTTLYFLADADGNIVQISTDGVILGLSDHVKFNLVQKNYPNPVKDFTTIPFHLKTPGDVTFKVMSSTGQIVHQESGFYGDLANEIRFDASDLPASTYIYSIETGGVTRRGKMIKK